MSIHSKNDPMEDPLHERNIVLGFIPRSSKDV